MTALIVRPTTQPSKPKKELKPITLRYEQQALKKQVYGCIRDGYKRIMVVAPCGFGKTILTASMVYDMTIRRDRKVLFLVHAKCLVEQTIEAFARYGIWAGAIAGGMKESRAKSVQVAMIQTLARGRDISWFKPDFVIADEAHEVAWSRWCLKHFPRLKDGQEIHSLVALDKELATIGIDITLFNNQLPSFEETKAQYKAMALKCHPDHGGSKEAMQEINAAWEEIRFHKDLFTSDRPTATPTLIGLTATPWRLSKKQSMGDLFPIQCVGPTPGEQVDLGVSSGYTEGLVPFVYWRIPGASTKTVKIRGRDFTEAELKEIGEQFSVPEVVNCAVDNYLSKAKGRAFACFPTSIRHAQLLHHAFNKAGVKAALVTGDTPNKQRQIVYQEIRDGFLAGIISVGCIGIGFDLPEISCIIDCCPTLSKSKYIQAAGRGQRLAPWIGKQDCVYLDQSGNVERHGMVEAVTYGSLAKSSEVEAGVAPVKECPNCGHIMLSLTMVCPECGYEFPVPKKEVAVGDMVLFVKDEEESLFHLFQDKVRQAYMENRKPRWAVYAINDKHKNHPVVAKNLPNSWNPRKEWYYHAIFEKPCYQDTQAYMAYLHRCTANDIEPKKEWWYRNAMEREFGKNWEALPIDPNYQEPIAFNQPYPLPEDF